MKIATPEQFNEQLKAWAEDPVRFFTEVLELDWLDPPCRIEGCTRCVPYARLIAESVRDNRRTIVAACHDSGKTFIAAAIWWWWQICFPPAIGVTSSSTGRQVKRGIWKEIRGMWRRAPFLRDHIPEPNLESWSMRNEPDWGGFGFSTNPDQAEAGATRVHSQHSRNLLLIFDEATAVNRVIWDAAKGSLTQEHNHWLVLANPTDPASEFATVWRTGQGWNRIEIDAADTPNLIHGDGTNPHLITQQWVDEYIADNGADHPLVQARVHGRIPDESVLSLISYADLARAYERDPPERPPEGWPKVTIGVDVAHFGDDLTAIYVVRGSEIVHSERYGKQDTVFTARRVIEVAEAWGLTPGTADHVLVDDTAGSVGTGVTDQLRAHDWHVRGEDFGAVAKNSERYYDRRTEIWCQLRDWLKGQGRWDEAPARLGALDDRERRRLEADLAGTQYEVRAKAGMTVMKLEAKKDMKKRLGRSPDNGDALALAVAGQIGQRRLDFTGLLHDRAAEGRRQAADAIRERDAQEDRDNELRRSGVGVSPYGGDANRFVTGEDVYG